MTESHAVPLSPQELRDLRAAKQALEHPGLIARVANVVGSPIERGLARLPQGVHERITALTHAVLLKSLEVSLRTLGDAGAPASNRLHRSLVALSGGIGGALGLVALSVELPISTGVMLRSIAEIARSEGQDLSSLPARLACLEVLALGGASVQDDAAENGYWAVRVALAQAIPHAVEQGAGQVVSRQLGRFIAAVAARFSVVVAEEALARLVPAVAGAVSGSVINVLFLTHFQAMARGHFIIKRLEAKYGTAVVQESYARA
jgi:hypothetical protein